MANLYEIRPGDTLRVARDADPSTRELLGQIVFVIYADPRGGGVFATLEEGARRIYEINPAVLDVVETIDARARRLHGKFFCRRCADKGSVVPADERYSMGVYAGMLCDPCWNDDGRNHDRRFDSLDAGERMDPEDP